MARQEGIFNRGTDRWLDLHGRRNAGIMVKMVHDEKEVSCGVARR